MVDGFSARYGDLLYGSYDCVDAHLIRMAGRFARRVRASAAEHGIPVIDCKRGERKHQIAGETWPPTRGFGCATGQGCMWG